MDRKEWTKKELMETSTNYWQACALQAANKLDIFSFIGDDDLTPEEISGRLGLSIKGVTALLNALAAMGLLMKKQDLYANTDISKELLVKGSPHYSGYIINHHHDLMKYWSRLDQAVKSGKPLRQLENIEEEDRSNFLMGMFNMAMAIAPSLADMIDFGQRKNLLDLGGGPGTYAIHFCLANPEMKASVFDLPATGRFAKKTIAQFGLENRIDFIAGNYLEEDIEGRYDAVWISHILHGEGPEACQMIIDKAVGAMNPGGILFIHEFILDNSLDSPLFAALFSLNMLVNTEDGRSYSKDQIKNMLKGAGLKDIQQLPFQGPNDSGILFGTF